jgi:uncharacterized protein (TIGR03083 family)
MDADALIEALASEGALLLDAVDAGAWDATVPGLDWNLHALAVHVGGVHRWATAIVRGASDDEVGAAYSRVGAGPAVDQLPEWLRAGIDDLVDALRTAPADLEAFTFLPAESPRHFWARRQAHETAVHRADAQAARGTVSPFPVEFAQDGIREMLDGFGARRRNAIAQAGTLLLRALDGGASWRLTFGGETIVAAPVGADLDADVVVTGSSTDLYLWLWNRPFAQIDLAGSEHVAQLWTETVRVRWS